MSENRLNVGMNRDNTYHATSNLNTVIENPQVNINNAMGMNIGNLNNNDVRTLNNNIGNNTNIIGNQFVNYEVGNRIVPNNNQGEHLSNGRDNYVNNIQGNNINLQNEFIPNESTTFINSSVVGMSDVSNNNSSNFNNNDSLNRLDSIKTTYEPTFKSKKNKPSGGLAISGEVKTMVVIILVLLLFIFAVPYVYDFFKELELIITSR
jgi:hypothetical protein